ncbi:MAG: metallophosphoesterase [Clostridia bacterium]|nr:metallophosphoesterase [Clostridia bacterium]
MKKKNRYLKKALVFCLAALMVMTALLPFTALAADTEASAFVPELRFVLCSDTHVLENSDQNEQRIKKMMELAYGIADGDSSYGRVDALLVAGDNTNDGTKTEFDKFAAAVFGSLREETSFLGVAAKNHDGYEMSRKEMRAYYSKKTGNDADFHVVIGGYHFIGLSASENELFHYSPSQLGWLKKQLDEAVKDDPERPVFFMHHEPVRGTVYGSSLYDGWGVTDFTAIVNRYPQIVDVAGHSHYPINDPRSVWQGVFTAVGTGAVYYSEFTVEGIRTYHPDDSHDTANCWIVELNAEHDMRLRGYDILAGEQLCELTLKNPADAKNREYTPEKREAASRAPEFENAEINATAEFGSCRVSVTPAKSADGMPVVLYRAYAKNSMGVKEAKTWVLPCYYRAVEQNEITLELKGLSKGEYTIGVVAENAYGKASEPIETKVSVDGETGFKSLIAKFIVWIEEIKEFFTRLFD